MPSRARADVVDHPPHPVTVKHHTGSTREGHSRDPGSTGMAAPSARLLCRCGACPGPCSPSCRACTPGPSAPPTLLGLSPPPTPSSPSLRRCLPTAELASCSGAHRFLCETQAGSPRLITLPPLQAHGGGAAPAHDSQPAGSAAPGGNPVLTACDRRGARHTQPPATTTPHEKCIYCLHKHYCTDQNTCFSLSPLFFNGSH